MSPNWRIDRCTDGGGSITADDGAAIARGLATPEMSGGGAITAISAAGVLGSFRVVADSGMSGATEFQDTRRSSRKSCFSLISGGLMSACMLLCRSRATDMTARFPIFGQSLFGIRDGIITLLVDD